jgi:hypothetical protein
MLMLLFTVLPRETVWKIPKRGSLTGSSQEHRRQNGPTLRQFSWPPESSICGSSVISKQSQRKRSRKPVFSWSA